MRDLDRLAERFDAHRAELRAVAYRMLGSTTEADDAVQEAWLRLARSRAEEIDNLGAWLTTVVGRVCLNVLRARAARAEVPLPFRLPDPVVEPEPTAGADPEHAAVLADSVGLALLVVLGTLTPDERLAFVMHDCFAVPFDEIAAMLGGTAAAARQHASRARRKIRGRSAGGADVDHARQRAVVDAFFAAARDGDLRALVAVLDPDVVLRSDGGARRERVSGVVRGAAAVAAQAASYSRLSPFVRPVLVNGAPGVVVAPRGVAFSIMAFTVRGGRIVAIDSLVDPDRLARLDLSAVLGG